MATIVDQKLISSEEWLISKAKSCLKADPFAAKAWFLTARTLYPRNFSIQFEAYTIEKNSKDVKRVAKLLEEMMINFSHEPAFWQEVQAMTEALQSDTSDEKTMFLKELFQTLPPALQSHMLLQVAESTKDVLQQCRLMLLILQRYPDKVPDLGVRLIESLLTTEKQSQCKSALNCYRKYLVCDVLPLVLKSRLPQLKQTHFIRWLQKAVEFYVCYSTQSPTDTPMSPTPDMMSPNKKLSSISFRRESIDGLTERESHIPRPWEKLFEIVGTLCKHIGWKIGDLYHKTSRESQWQQINSMFQQAKQNQTEGNTQYKQVLYTTTVLFVDCMYKYCCKMDPTQFSSCTGTENVKPQLVLIEGFKTENPAILEHRSKKLKMDPTPYIDTGSNISHSTELQQNFITAVKCWHLLHSVEPLEKDFNRLLQHWKAEQWQWLKCFEIDMLIHQGQYKEALNKLQTIKSTKKSQDMRVELQMSCCLYHFYCMGNMAKSCEIILGVVASLPPTTQEMEIEPASSLSGRRIQLLQVTAADLLPYCIQLLITCLREKAIKTYAPNDMCLGHLLVLLQFNWPRFEGIYAEVLDKIKRQGSFTYNLFFSYVTNIDILEELAHLKTQDGIKLDILPISTKTLQQTRTVTRGVNKGVKEDFKVAMEKQVMRALENPETVIRQFIVGERTALQENLM